ncbi:MAG: N-acetylmuramoyl-L-alanine amidase [bacterium]
MRIKLAKSICFVGFLSLLAWPVMGVAPRTSLIGPKPSVSAVPEGYVPAVDVCKALSTTWLWDPLLGRFEIKLPNGERLILLVDSNYVGCGERLFRLNDPVRFVRNRLLVPMSLVRKVLESELGYTLNLPTPTPETASFVVSPPPTPVIDFGSISMPPELRPTATIEEKEVSYREGTTAQRPVVVLDPGHGGEDTGSIGVGSTIEAELVLAIAQLCEESIQLAFDIDVSLTRREQRYLSTLERVAFANSLNARVFVSLHAGGLIDPKMNIPSVFLLSPPVEESVSAGDRSSVQWWDSSSVQRSLIQWRLGSAAWFKESRDLADSLHEALLTDYEDFQTIDFEEGPRQARLAVLRGLLMPGALVELGSLTSLEAEQILTKEGFQRRIADSLALAIGNWIYRQEGRPPRDSLIP